MKELTEVRWHARAGQGAVTASKLLAEAAMEEGFYIQAFPEYGAEREGAPVRSFTRISTTPVRVHSQIYEPDVVLILDSTLIGSVNATEGLREGGAIIINTPKNPAEMQDRMGDLAGKFKIFTVDATSISLDAIGRPMPNIPMLGAFIWATGLLDFRSVAEKMRKVLSKKFGEKILEGNLVALKRGYEEVKS